MAPMRKRIQEDAKFDKICYINFVDPNYRLKGGLMDKSRMDNVIALYQDAGSPVVLFDDAGALLWKNRAASDQSFDYVGSDLFAKAVFTQQTKASLARTGSAYVRPGAAFANMSGIMLSCLAGGVLAVFDRSEMGSPLHQRFSTDGFDSFSNLVRTSLDRLTLSATSAEYAADTDDPDVEQLFANIRLNAYQILRGLNNASLLSKYASGTLTLNRRNCDIGELTRALCLSVQSVLKRHMEIEVKVKGAPVVANVDLKLCERALLNLLANAIRYTRDGNRIVVTVSENAGLVHLVVHDSGAGIREENTALVTKPYFSCEPADDGGPAPGLGLGLSVASVFCETHGGALVLNSRFGEGTTVALSFRADLSDEPCFRATVSSYVTDRFSPLYIELCDLCEIPK